MCNVADNSLLSLIPFKNSIWWGFKATEVEIIELLNRANIPVTKLLKSKKKLIEFAANSISGIGLYQRISNHDT